MSTPECSKQPRVPSPSVTQSSAHRFLHQRADPCLFGGSQLLQREGGRPHRAFVEVRLVHEAERRVPRLELLRALEEVCSWACFVPQETAWSGSPWIRDR